MMAGSAGGKALSLALCRSRRRSAITIAELAEEAGVTASWFARVVRSSFLSPRITTARVDGTQPLELPADRLLKLRPVPTSWKGPARDSRIRLIGRPKVQLPLKTRRKRRFFLRPCAACSTCRKAKRSGKVGSRDIRPLDGANSGANGSLAGVAGWAPGQAFEMTLQFALGRRMAR